MNQRQTFTQIANFSAQWKSQDVGDELAIN